MSLRPASHRPDQAGASLLELMMVLAIAGFAMTAIVSFLAKSSGNMSRVEATSQLIAANQRISANLHTGLASALMLVENSPAHDFTNLHSRMVSSIQGVTGTPKPVSFTVQPLIQDATPLDISSMAGAVGNELFYVSSLPPVTFTVYISNTALVTAATAGAMGYVVSVDRVQFVALYLSQQFGRGMKNGQTPLRLTEWRSVPLVVYSSINQAASSVYLTGTCQGLIALGYDRAVDLTAITDTAQAYYPILSTGVLTGGVAPTTFAQSSWAYVDEYNMSQSFSVRPNVNRGRIAGEKTGPGVAAPETFSFAFNSVTTSTRPTTIAKYTNISRDGGRIAVPAWAVADAGSKAGFPGGFEVLIAGRPSAREVLLRHVVIMGSGDAISRGSTEFLALDAQDYQLCDLQPGY